MNVVWCFFFVLILYIRIAIAIMHLKQIFVTSAFLHRSLQLIYSLFRTNLRDCLFVASSLTIFILLVSIHTVVQWLKLQQIQLLYNIVLPLLSKQCFVCFSTFTKNIYWFTCLITQFTDMQVKVQLIHIVLFVLQPRLACQQPLNA